MQVRTLNLFDTHVVSTVLSYFPRATIKCMGAVISDRVVPEDAIRLYYTVPIELASKVLDTGFWPSSSNTYGSGIYLLSRLRVFNEADKVAVIVCRASIKQITPGFPTIALPLGTCAVDNVIAPEYYVFQDPLMIYPEHVVVFTPT